MGVNVLLAQKFEVVTALFLFALVVVTFDNRCSLGSDERNGLESTLEGGAIDANDTP